MTQDTRPGRYRWVICGLLLAAMAINYIQRQTIGLLKSPLQHEFSLDEVGYANIVFWFQAAYAVGYVTFGRVLDRIGAQNGLCDSLHSLESVPHGRRPCGQYGAVHPGAGRSGSG